MARTLLEPAQIAQTVYDPGTETIKVSGSFTSSEGATATEGAAAPAVVKVVAGTDGGGLVRTVSTDTDGDLQVDVLSSALPTGASTSAKQPALGTAGTASADVITVQGIVGATAIKVDGSASTQPVSGTVTVTQATGTNLHTVIDSGTISLPTGASTAANQATEIASLASIDGKVPANLTVTATRLLVDASGTTQPVSGTITVTQATGTNLHTVIDSGTISLPTGASTLAEQQTQTTSLQLLDDSVATTGAAITAKGIAAVGTDGTNARILKTDTNGELQVDVLTMPTVTIQDGGGSVTVDGTVTVTATDLDIRDLTSVSDSVSAVQSGTWNVTNVTGTVSLPTGAATSANQTNKTQYTHITDGTDDALVTAAGELNVIASAQPGVDIGDVTINNAAGAGAINIQDGGNSITVDGTVAATQSGTWSVRLTDGTDTALVTAAGELNVVASAQPGVDVGDVTVNNAAGAAAVNIQDGGNSITVDGTVASTQSGTWNINNITGTVSLPTGAATEATLSLMNDRMAGSLVPFEQDYVGLSYTGENLTTVVYKTGGAGGTTTATLTLAYTGSTLISVTRT